MRSKENGISVGNTRTVNPTMTRTILSSRIKLFAIAIPCEMIIKMPTQNHYSKERKPDPLIGNVKRHLLTRKIYRGSPSEDNDPLAHNGVMIHAIRMLKQVLIQQVPFYRLEKKGNRYLPRPFVHLSVSVNSTTGVFL